MVVTGGTVVVTGGTVVVAGGSVVVDVVVVVSGGMTNPFAHPHRISIGAPTLVPTAFGIASIARRNCDQPSQADTPVVGHPLRT